LAIVDALISILVDFGVQKHLESHEGKEADIDHGRDLITVCIRAM